MQILTDNSSYIERRGEHNKAKITPVDIAVARNDENYLECTRTMRSQNREMRKNMGESHRVTEVRRQHIIAVERRMDENRRDSHWEGELDDEMTRDAKERQEDLRGSRSQDRPSGFELKFELNPPC